MENLILTWKEKETYINKMLHQNCKDVLLMSDKTHIKHKFQDSKIINHDIFDYIEINIKYQF